jgi:hypothetical protein
MARARVVLLIERIEQDRRGFAAGGFGLVCDHNCPWKSAQPFHHVPAGLHFDASS